MAVVPNDQVFIISQPGGQKLEAGLAALKSRCWEDYLLFYEVLRESIS